MSFWAFKSARGALAGTGLSSCVWAVPYLVRPNACTSLYTIGRDVRTARPMHRCPHWHPQGAAPVFGTLGQPLAAAKR